MLPRTLLPLPIFVASSAFSQPLSCAIPTGCVPEAAGDLSIDDVPTIEAAIKSCGSGGTISIPAGTTYSIRSPLHFDGCNGCAFEIEGTLLVSDDVDYWSRQSSIIVMSGIKDASMYSATGSGLIDGNGQRAWDAFAGNSSLSRPVLHSIQGGSSNITIRDLKIRNAPTFSFTVGGGSTGINYNGLDLNAVSSSNNVAKNTDGFDIGASTYVTISSTTVTNDDDCVAFKPGSNFATVRNLTCFGSHGVSIGSLGRTPGITDTVSNILVSEIAMHNSTKAVGIKLWPGGSSYGTAVVSNVTFEHVIVASSDYAAQIMTCYGGSSAAYCASNPSTAKISGVVFRDFKGTTSAKYAPNIANLDCSPKGICDVHLEDWSVKAPKGTATILEDNLPDTTGLPFATGASG
ncbi:glycoside hydrolase family 28 protein [Myriangium duriaei CBS 260.36]|uniref:Glycoside hydrolase family 28 protein n=1 Tax=Myriangium duriaei CBS 260.36 TaxID=1168546 RepID=A0A9P4J066_9PEZI|nr:glycoside hydrolase family 28 protein [Myriangium duriaei CBS 260.36]